MLHRAFRVEGRIWLKGNKFNGGSLSTGRTLRPATWPGARPLAVPLASALRGPQQHETLTKSFLFFSGSFRKKVANYRITSVLGDGTKLKAVGCPNVSIGEIHQWMATGCWKSKMVSPSHIPIPQYFGKILGWIL
jgi:hypothetical protein